MPSTTLYVDVAVPIYLNQLSAHHDYQEVRFGRLSWLAGWIHEQDGSWYGTDLSRETVTELLDHRREAARQVVLHALGGRRPPERA